jgi:hypothetical protein
MSIERKSKSVGISVFSKILSKLVEPSGVTNEQI